MHGNIPASTAIPALLCTQLLAAEVYTYYFHVSSEGEKDLWKKMLVDELEHVEHLRRVLMDDAAHGVLLPKINVERMRETATHVTALGRDMFLMRLEGALRLECAELDYGLEGLAARRLRQNRLSFEYPGDISAHITHLMNEAERYAESHNIGVQITRLGELLESSLSDTVHISREEDSLLDPQNPH